MSSIAYRWISLGATVAIASVFSLSACSIDAGDPDSEELTGADENVAANHDAITGSVAVGTTLVATTNVNLRTGPSTSYSILHVVPQGSQVTVVASEPQNGFYKVKHNGTTGWSSGQYYNKVATSGTGSAARDAAISRAKSGVGFSYW
jgi:uncharacterized protein YgiM (DUF1202 family)